MKKLLLILAMMLPCLGAWAEVVQPETGVYVISGDVDGRRGNLAAVEGITDHPALSGITWDTYKKNSATPITNGEHWYVYQVGEKYVIYNLGLKKYLFNPKDGSKIDFSDTPYLWDILVNSSNGNFNSIWDATGTYLCFACGKSAANRNVHFNNQAGDGGSLHTFTAVENGEETYAKEIQEITLTYTVTDNAGYVYTGDFLGTAGETEPTFLGVVDYSLSNGEWDGNNFTANITFPFPVYKNVIISSFKGTKEAGSRMYYVATNDSVNVMYGPSQQPGKGRNEWIIEPSCNNTAFTFKIKNVSTQKYITTSATNTSDAEGTVTLTKDGTAFTVETDNRFKLPTTTSNGSALYLSEGSSGSNDKYLGAWTWNGSHGVHYGNCNYIYEVELPYEITDNAGNVFRGTVNAEYGNAKDKIPTNSTFTGANGYTLSAFTFDGMKNTATINFPFPVSSATAVNTTLIGQGTWERADKKWTVVDGNVKVVNGTATLGASQWAIYPSLNGTEFTFKIMSASTGKFVTANPASNADAEAKNTPITLTENGTGFQFINTGLANTNGFAYKNNGGTTLFITRNGENDNNELLGVYGTSGSHKGNGIRFPELTSYQFTVGPTGYASLYSPIAGAFDGDVKIYAIESASNNSATLEEKTGVAANKGAIIKATPGTYTFNFGEVSSDEWSNNLLKGSSVNTLVNESAYVLTPVEGEAVLALADLNKDEAGATGTTHFLNNAGKAYLPASAITTTAQVLRFNFGGTTGIEDAVVAPSFDANAPIYDLSGRRVMNTVKGGIYIQNGKKFIVK